MTVSLYRKYRPVRFEDVMGQSHVTRTLINAIRQDRVSHAYLFAGPRGTGKTSTAKILAMALNCESGHGKATTEPDGTCLRCEPIRRGSSLDVLEIDAASNRGIDEIRELRDRVQFAPVEGRMKVYIVDEVHMLTPEAFNALLKMLEEPPAHVIFVLATTEPHRILPTILSRCQRFDFRRPTLAELVKVLASVAQREGIEVSENTLSVIARAAGGSFRDAVGTLDQLNSYCEGTIGLQDALALLGVAEQDLLFELVDIVDERDSQTALLFVERLVQGGTDLNQFLKDALGHLRDLYVVQHTIEPPASIGVSEEHLDGLRSQANRVSTAVLLDFIDLVGEAQRAVRQGADPRLELEVLLIKLTRPDTDLSLRGLAARLDRLEAGQPPDTPPRREPASRPRATPAPVPSATAPGPSAAPPTTVGAATGNRALRAVPDPATPADPHDAARSAEDDEVASGPAPAAVGPDNGPPQLEADLDTLKRAWPVILTAIKRERPSLHAILAEGRPDALEDDTLVIRFAQGMDFHVTQLAKPDNEGFLRDTLRQITGRNLAVSARLSGAAAEEPAAENEGAILTTEELVQILKQEFDARPIDGDPQS